MRVFVVNPLTSGHNETYTRSYRNAFLALGATVITLYPDPARIGDGLADSPVIKIPELDWAEIRSPTEYHLTTILRRWSSVKTALNQAGYRPQKDDLFFFVWLDSYLYRSHGWRSFFGPLDSYLFSLLHRYIFPYSWSGLYISPKYLRSGPLPPRIQRSFRPDLLFRSQGCQGVYLLDEGVVDCLRHRNPHIRAWASPDFCDTSLPDSPGEQVRALTAYAQGRPVVGLFGQIDKRKGVLTFLDWADQMAGAGVYFALCGPLQEASFSASELLRLRNYELHPRPNVYACFKAISDESGFNALVSASAVIFLTYFNFRHSSNLLAKAAFFQRPVISCEEHCIGERVRAFHLGATVPAHELDRGPALITALLHETAHPSPQRLDGSRRYVAIHSLTALTHVLKPLLPASCLQTRGE
jgi:hypothetical protein